MQKIKNFALYARSELEKQDVDAHTAKSGYIAMIINRYAEIHGIDERCDDSIIPQYIKEKFSADVMSADIFDVESLSWLYQYFVNIDRKNTVDAISGLETANRSVVAATQVFTPKWIVQYLVDNSLGRYWSERHSNTNIGKQLKYYIPHATGRDTQLNPREIAVFDPCCGCGNILIYSFDVLMMMYRETGVPEADAARTILQCNLHGADIDEHAAQIARFAIMAKAFEYDKSIFISRITPNIEVISNDGIGSLDYNISPHSVTSRRFDIVCTNPPYLARMSRRLKDFTSRYIKPYSKDLFTAFMYRGLEYCTDEGYMAYMTPNVWMFLTSHKNIRHYILDNKHICTLLQLEKGSYFSEASVDICAFVIKNQKSNEQGIYISPNTGARTLDSQRSALLTAVNALNSDTACEYVYKCSAGHFNNIPERLVAYRTDNSVTRLFANPSIGDVYTVKQGMTTGNNKKFLRYWWQVPYGEIGFGCADTADAAQSGKTWFPYNKGGKYRKWYGNNEYVVMYADDGKEMKEYTSRLPQGTWVRLKSREYYFRESVTWSFISSSKFGVRYSPGGSIFDVAGSSLFGENLEYVLGFLSSKVAYYFLQLLNPTMNYQIRDIKAVPFIYNADLSDDVVSAVRECISIAKEDWDSSETSYNFRKNPVAAMFGGLPLCEAVSRYLQHKNLAFDTMHNNENKLNDIFINLYGLSNILNPHTPDSDITINPVSEKTIVRDLLSYCVGLALGRFLPDGGINSIYRPSSVTIDELCSFCENYLTKTFGSCDTQYMARVTGTDNRDFLKNYYTKHFIKDHAKKYKGCPVYFFDKDVINYELTVQR